MNFHLAHFIFYHGSSTPYTLLTNVGICEKFWYMFRNTPLCYPKRIYLFNQKYTHHKYIYIYIYFLNPGRSFHSQVLFQPQHVNIYTNWLSINVRTKQRSWSSMFVSISILFVENNYTFLLTNTFFAKAFLFDERFC